MVESEIKRKTKWPYLLLETIDLWRGVKFEYGQYDCLLFTADCVRAITDNDIDIAANLRARYGSAEDLTKLFGTNWLYRLDELYSINLGAQGFTEIGVRWAKRGDMIMHRGELFTALGICLGRYSYFLGPRGLVSIETLQCDKAWRV